MLEIVFYLKYSYLMLHSLYVFVSILLILILLKLYVLNKFKEYY